MEYDYKKHKSDAISSYSKLRPTYELFAYTLKEILTKTLKEKRINYHSIEARAKEIESFGNKASKPSETNPNKPKYSVPIKEITDLSGVRIIAFFPKTIKEIGKVIESQFEVIEVSDKSEILEKEEKLGYQSVHYLVKLKENRLNLPEYQTFDNMVSEIQVRTILQHAWAEIEHDIKYKSTITIPSNIKRRFIALAGVLEIADREFQSIQDEDKKLKTSDRKSVKEGKLDEVQITPDSFKAYLDKTLGSDGRISNYSYNSETEYLIKMGFKNLSEIDNCIKPYIDKVVVDNAVWGARQGQIWRFNDYLLAGMGEKLLKKHPRVLGNHWLKERYTDGLKNMEKSGVKIGTFELK
ncbi:hypothetical protein Q4Q35_14520 [Flavivirga aquimarina]|uniref:RelA/SpoT domain-containing protein n=1 Tax=Flavivirga aquimarina TaxID=2027862 RepID=A0ABT8WDA4_9FLAO|nr:hypothetical protein [Flavivirga aquimarina]MDO5971019.1 hypothetical protein [Flavivirga aquimarina]